MRSLAAIAIGFALAVAAAALVACFVDPNPPYPHGDAGWTDDFLSTDGGDGGEAGQ